MVPSLIVAAAVVGTGAWEPYSTSAWGQSVCAGGATVSGFDASKYEGNIDWSTVKAAGIGFGITRVSDGLNFPDATFDTNWAAMKSEGMVRGAYQYFEPAQDPVAQADMVLQHIGFLGAGDLPPILDVETMGGVSASAVLAAVDKWLVAVQSATGRRPIVYASPSFWDGLGDPTVDADLWIANWGVSCPSVPAAWSSWKVWQYTATGTVPGVPVTQVDLDRFNGSMSDLLAYAAGALPSPATIASPAAGATVSGTITVSASANATAARVEIYADSTLLGTGSSASWSTTSVADGAHQLTAKAFDASGASITSPAVGVTVSNSSGGGCSALDPLGAACPPPPPVGCNTSTGGAALLLASLVSALALRRLRERRAAHALSPRAGEASAEET
jgi:lysozyme